MLRETQANLYPNPKDKKYRLNPFKQVEKDYIYATGGTEVFQNFLTQMSQIQEQIDYYKAKEEGRLKEHLKSKFNTAKDAIRGIYS